MNYSIREKPKGFNMVELLTALLIVAQIATFSIPKIVHAQQNALNKARFKETYAALYDATRWGVIKGVVGHNTTNNAHVYAHYKKTLNWAKYCNNVWADGCRVNPIKGFDAANQGTTTNRPGVILHNGVHVIFGILGGAGTCRLIWMYVDYNGEDGPNKHLKDQVEIRANFSPGSGMCEGTQPEMGIGGRPGGDHNWIVTILQ